MRKCGRCCGWSNKWDTISRHQSLLMRKITQFLGAFSGWDAILIIPTESLQSVSQSFAPKNGQRELWLVLRNPNGFFGPSNSWEASGGRGRVWSGGGLRKAEKKSLKIPQRWLNTTRAGVLAKLQIKCCTLRGVRSIFFWGVRTVCGKPSEKNLPGYFWHGSHSLSRGRTWLLFFCLMPTKKLDRALPDSWEAEIVRHAHDPQEFHWKGQFLCFIVHFFSIFQTFSSLIF